jgi:hypothetical protein
MWELVSLLVLLLVFTFKFTPHPLAFSWLLKRFRVPRFEEGSTLKLLSFSFKL